MSEQQNITNADVGGLREVIGPDNPDNEGEFLVNDLPTTPGKFEGSGAGGDVRAAAPRYGGEALPLSAPPGQEAGSGDAAASDGFSRLIQGTTTDGVSVIVFEKESTRGGGSPLTTADVSDALDAFGDRLLSVESTERGIQVRVLGETAPIASDDEEADR